MPADRAAASLYSVTTTPTLTPWAASPAPSVLVVWYNDLDERTFAPQITTRRGSVIRTMGSNVVHDMGAVLTDARLRISGTVDAGTWISAATAQALSAAYAAGCDTEYYFCDGWQVWRVRFLPAADGLDLSLSLNWKYATGQEYYSWSMTLMVLEGPLEIGGAQP